ncbi:hypothetical protein [Megasphaera sp.]|uniref:hypothetical protein n=1 Tax=Megasphaera sp. TaxID=2023260 RepID=UPI00352295A4
MDYIKLIMRRKRICKRKMQYDSKGIRLAGKVRVVDYGEDFTVQFVNSFPDIRIQFVQSFPGVP